MATPTTPEERMQRFRAGLISRTEGLSLVEVGSQVAALQSELVRSLEGLAASQVAFKPSPDDWCIGEVASHVCRSTAAVREGLRLALADQPTAVNLRVAPSGGPVDALALAKQDRKETDHILQSLAASNPGLIVNLGMVGEVECKPCLAFLLYHIGDHVKQIAAVKANPSFPPS